jgi:hypothetical protein
MLNGVLFFRMVKKRKLTVFKASLNNINNTIEAKDVTDRPLEKVVPEPNHQFLQLFKNVIAER